MVDFCVLVDKVACTDRIYEVFDFLNDMAFVQSSLLIPGTPISHINTFFFMPESKN